MSWLGDMQMWLKCRKPFAIIEKHLPAYQTFDGEHWHLRQGSKTNLAREISSIFQKPDLADTEGVECIKIKPRRRIFRVSSSEGIVVVKGFFFHGSLGRQWYRHCFYALDEAINLLIARERGLPVPDVVAYGEKRSLGRRLFNVAVIENVAHAVHPTQIFRGEVQTRISVQDALSRVASMLEMIYNAGCNHIDMHGTSFLLNEETATKDKIIDFQFAVFHPTPSVPIFCHQLAHFIRASRKDLPEDMLDDWAAAVLRRIDPPDFDEAMREVRKLSTRPVASEYARMTLKP